MSISRFIVVVLVVLGAGRVGAAPVVVSTIAPVHALVQAVLGTQSTLLIKGTASPHGFSLKPSQLDSLAKADALFWIGPELEGFLPRVLAAQELEHISVPLLTSAGLFLKTVRIHAARDDGDHEQEQHEEHHHDAEKSEHAHHDDTEHDHHDHKPGAIDPHIWLDPLNAIAMVTRIEKTLVRLAPERADTYRANAEKLRQDLSALDHRLRARLDEVQSVPFVVYHDAYQYFDSRYGLNSVGSVTADPERRGGARHLSQLHQIIQDTQAQCLFTEPQFKNPVSEQLASDLGLHLAMLDPLGSEGVSYRTMLDNLASEFVRCLGR